MEKVEKTYSKLKKKFLGTIDVRLCVSQDKNIYPTIKNIFFSPNVQSDDIDSKTLGILNLITESKFTNSSIYEYHNNLHDLYMDSSHNIVIEKRNNFGGSISKKYFKFQNYIVVSENKKIDFSYYYHDEKKDDKKDEKEEKKEYFIMFEAIRATNNAAKDNDIIKKFLYEKINLNK